MVISDWVLSSVTGAFKGSVYPKAAKRSQSFRRSQKQSRFTAHEHKSLGLDGQERSFPVHLPTPARGAWMSFVRNEEADDPAEAHRPQVTRTARPARIESAAYANGGTAYADCSRIPPPIYASLSELVRESLLRSLVE